MQTCGGCSGMPCGALCGSLRRSMPCMVSDTIAPRSGSLRCSPDVLRRGVQPDFLRLSVAFWNLCGDPQHDLRTVTGSHTHGAYVCGIMNKFNPLTTRKTKKGLCLNRTVIEWQTYLTGQEFCVQEKYLLTNYLECGILQLR